MNIATLLVALIATSAADAPGDPVLLDFQATWCHPCQVMRPVVDKLVEKGYPVRQIDIDRSPEMSERYKVTAVPTFVVVDARGKELARTQGIIEPAQLANFYNKAKLKAAASAPADDARDQAEPAESPAEGAALSDPGSPNPNPWETVVRIKMHLSDSEWGFGSGTIISSTAEESIILTCAHIFKVKGTAQPSPRNFRVPITVDLFGGQLIRRQPALLACTEKDIVGEAIDYDFTHDVGLIRIRPGRKLAASKVVPASWQPQKGMKMTTVGCSHGQDATAWSTTILSPRVGMSNTATKQAFATIKCAFQPMEGRSGGGLYTSDGYVAGVCDFADPNEHVGLYAVPEAIHRLLDQNQLTALYKPQPSGGDVLLAATGRTRPKPSTGTKYRAQNAEEPASGELVTLPPKRVFGIDNPPANAALASRGSRSVVRPDSSPVDEVDPGVPAGEARTTDLASDPGPDARALEDLPELPPAPVPARQAANTPTNKPKTSGWKPVRPNASEGMARRSSN